MKKIMLSEPIDCKLNGIEIIDKLKMEESIILPGKDGARISKLAPSGKMLQFLHQDVQTIHDAIKKGCEISGNGRCVGWRSSNTEYSWLSYQQFIKRTEHFGSGLIHLGANLGKSSFIGIYAQNSIEWLIAQHGCFNYSSPIIPLYDTLGTDACTYMINHGDINTIVCDKEQKVKALLDKKEATPTLKHIVCVQHLSDSTRNIAIKKGVKLHLFEDIENIGKLKPVQTKPPQSTDLAEICYTSGTTGDPKGAMLTHGNIISGASAAIYQMGSVAPTKTDTMISYLPLAHVMEQICELVTFMQGGCVGFFKGDLTLLLSDMQVLKPTFFPAVPRLLNKLFDKVQQQLNSRKIKKDENGYKEKEKLQKASVVQNGNTNLFKPFSDSLGGKVKLILTAAAPISDVVLKFYLKALECNVVEIYGQTETSGPCTANVVSEKSAGNVGPPVPCCIVKLVDVPELGYFTSRNTGEMCVKGYTVLKGYYKDPEKTAETIDADGWMHTGDIAMWLPNGTLKIIDRKKHIFKLSQGEYIAPEKVENIYLQSPYIAQLLIHGESLQDYLVAIVMPDEDVVMSWCKENSKCSTWAEVCKDPAVNQLIFDDMQRIAKKAGLLSFEKVKKIHLCPKLLSLEAGHLTPTLKTKRNICKEYFEKEIQEMYGEKLLQTVD